MQTLMARARNNKIPSIEGLYSSKVQELLNYTVQSDPKKRYSV